MLASRGRVALATVMAALTCAACGSSSHPSAQAPVSLQDLHGNSFAGVTYAIDVSGDGRLTVRRIARFARLTATEAIVTLTVSDGSGRLTAAERAQVKAVLRHVDLRQVRAAGVRGACHGAPIGDVGGFLLDVGGTRTDCPPTSAQPLVSWLQSLAVVTPEKVIQKSVNVRHLTRTGSRA